MRPRRGHLREACLGRRGHRRGRRLPREGGVGCRPGQMREELDEIHVDIGVLIPDHFLKMLVISQVDYASVLACAYNAWLLEEWCSPESVLPVTIPSRRARCDTLVARTYV